LSLAQYLESIHAPKALVDFLKSRATWLFGRNFSEINATHLFDAFTFDTKKGDIEFFLPTDDPLRPRGGTEVFAQAIAKEIPTQLVHYKATVEGIRSESVDGKVSVKIVDQDWQSFDYVICTIDLIDLRKIKYSIKGMSQEVNNAIQKSQYSNIGNVYISFAGKPWEDAHHFGYVFDVSGYVASPVITGRDFGILKIYMGGDLVVKLARASESERVEWVRQTVQDLNKIWPTAGEKFKKDGSRFLFYPDLNAYSGSDGPGKYFVGKRYFGPFGRFFMAGEFNSAKGQEGFTGTGVTSAIESVQNILKREGTRK
jgi:hypothetical protein